MIDVMKVGKLISVCRREKNFTQEELAARLGVTPQAVSRWERGNALPDIEFLMPISSMLGVSIEDLLSGDLTDKTTACRNEAAGKKEPEKPVIRFDEFIIHIALNLCVNNDNFINPLLDGIKKLRADLASKHGIILPVVRIRDDTSLNDNEYEILLREKTVGKGMVYKGMSFTQPNMEWDPKSVSNGSVIWANEDEILPEDKEKYRNGSSMICTHFTYIVENNFEKIVKRDMAKELADMTAVKYPMLVQDTVPVKISYAGLARLLVGILNQGKPVRDMLSILENVYEADNLEDIQRLAEQIAVKL